MNKLILVLAMSLVSVSGFAQSEEDMNDEIATQTFYTVQCGSLDDLLKMDPNNTATADQATDEDLKEIYEIRASVQGVLLKGNEGIKALLDLGSQQDTGPFGAIMACQILNLMEPMVKKDGCVVDLKTNKKVYDGPGFNACAKFLGNVPK